MKKMSFWFHSRTFLFNSTDACDDFPTTSELFRIIKAFVDLRRELIYTLLHIT